MVSVVCTVSLRESRNFKRRDAQHPEDAVAMLQRRIAAALKRRRFALAASLYMALATEALAQVRPDVKWM